MKKAFLFIFLFSAYFTNAQNYQCLQSGVKHYFINGNGYLRGVRIDSVKTFGSTTFYYPFHTRRGSYDGTPYTMPLLDSNGGSWLGKKVQQLSDGTFIFDSYWNDSVIIKTQANIGDSWILYSDTSNLWYKATLIGIDTMTVLGTVDSIKKILVTAQNPSGIVTSDPLDSFQIFLGKNHGFVQVFDLYTFPYHKPDSVYRVGLDFFLDRSTLTNVFVNQYFGNAPNPNITLFKLIDFINPNDQQLHNWDVGDVIGSEYANGTSWPIGPYKNILDTVTSKVVSGSSINYYLKGSSGTSSISHFHICTFITSPGLNIFNDFNFPIVDTSYIPEENFNRGCYVFYFPYDTTYCLSAPAYIKLPFQFHTGGLGGYSEYINYKLGIGMTSYQYSDGEPTWDDSYLTYYSINGVGCPVIDKIINAIPKTIQIQLYPNPATTSLIITSTEKINQITITNLLGQTQYTHEYNTEKVQVDVAGLANGIHFIKINGSEVRKFVKE